jgi:hypothetical protein
VKELHRVSKNAVRLFKENASLFSTLCKLNKKIFQVEEDNDDLRAYRGVQTSLIKHLKKQLRIEHIKKTLVGGRRLPKVITGLVLGYAIKDEMC